MPFDPTQPFEAVDDRPAFDPSQPYEAVAVAEFDPSQPFEVVDELTPEQVAGYDAQMREMATGFGSPIGATARLGAGLEIPGEPKLTEEQQAQKNEADYRLTKEELTAQHPELDEAGIMALRKEIQQRWDTLHPPSEFQKPLMTLPKPSGPGVGAGIVRGVENLAESLTTPENIMLMTGIGAAPKVLQKAAALGFGVQMATGAGQQFAAAEEAKTPGEAAERITEAIGSLGLSLVATKHGVTKAKAPAVVAQKAAELREVGAPVTAAVLEKQASDLPPMEPIVSKAGEPEVAPAYEAPRTTPETIGTEPAPQTAPEIKPTERQVSTDEKRIEEEGQGRKEDVASAPGADAEASSSATLSGESAKKPAGKSVERSEQVGQEPVLAEALAPAPKLRKGQKQGDLLGGSEELTLRGEKAPEKPAAAPKPQPTVEETVSDAVRAYGDLASAHEHLQTQIEHPKTPKADRERMRAAQRKMESIMEQEHRREQAGEAQEAPAGTDELIASVKELGGLPTLAEQGAAATGELGRVIEAKKGVFLNLFRKGAPSLDTLREALGERGFQFETPYDMLTAIEESLVTGRKRYGTQFGGEGYRGGPGAEGPIEAAEMAGAPKLPPTGLQRKVVDTERLLEGREEIPTVEREAEAERVSRAEDRVFNDPSVAPSLVARIVDAGDRAIGPDDAAVLLVERQRLRNRRESLEDAGGNPETSPEERIALQEEWKVIEEQINRLDHAQRISGSTWGRVGHMYQRMIQEDFSLEKMERKARMDRGRELYPEEAAKIKEQYEAIAARDIAETKRLAEIEIKQAREAAEAQVKALREEIENVPKVSKRVLAWAENFVQGLEKKADEADRRMKQRQQKTNIAVDPMIIVDMAQIFAAKMARKALTLAEARAVIMAQYGEEFMPYVARAYEKALALLSNPEGRRKKPKVAPPVAPAEAIEIVQAKELNVEAVVEGIKGAIDEGATLGGKVDDLVKKLARAYAEAGVRELDPLIDKIHARLSPMIEGLTKRQVMDAFSDYGKSRPAPTEEVKVRLSQMRGEAQNVSKLQDIVEKQQAPLATGQRRVPPSEETRRLTQKINEAKKKYGIETRDPERQLTSALDSRKTYYRNRLADLRFEIDRKQRIVRDKTAPPTDPELDALKAEYEQVKAEHDSVFGKREMTDEQRLAAAIAAAERSQAVWEAKLADAKRGVFPEAALGKFVPKSERLAALKARNEAIREEVASLRDLDTALQEAAKERSLQAAIEKAQQAIPQPKPAVQTVDTQRVSELKQRLEELRTARASSPEMQQRQIDRAIRAVEDSIAEKDRIIREGDLAPKPGRPQITSDRLETLRAERAAMAELIRELRAAERPKLTEAERGMRALKSRLLKEIADLQERLVKRDFTKKVRKPRDYSGDPELVRIQAERDRIKAEYLTENRKEWFKNLSRTRRALLRTEQALDAGKNLTTSMDLSAPRQGLIGVLTHPITARKAFGKMLKAAVSETAARDMEQARNNRRNADNGYYDVMEVERTALEETKFTKTEENMRSIFDEWAELPFKTGSPLKSIAMAGPKAIARAVRGSNRAFITFLNELRLDLADALVDANYRNRPPPSPNELKVLGNYVNIATGRGRIDPRLARGAAIPLWSPRLLASRFQYLIGQPLWHGIRSGKTEGTKRARLAIAKEYAKLIGGAYALWNVAKFSGVMDDDGLITIGDVTIDTDPRGSDFLKLRTGKDQLTRLDPWGGLQQVTVLFSKIGTQEGKKVNTGKIESISGDSVVMRFLRTKFSPIFGSAWNWSVGGRTNVIGEPVTAFSTAQDVLMPLSFRDVFDVMQDNGIPKGIALMMLAQFGVGLAVYNDESRERPR